MRCSTHNNDMPDYGLPPVNGGPAAVNRKNFYGATDDRTLQDVANLNATISHKFTRERDAAQPDAVLALPDQRARVRAEQRRHAVGERASTRRSRRPISSNTTALPLESLYVGHRQPRPGHHRFVALQPDRPHHRLRDRADPASADHRPRARPGHERHAATRPATSRAIRTSSFASCRSSTRLYAPAAGLPSVHGQPGRRRSATDVAPYINDTMSFADYWKVVAGVRYDRYHASLTNSINLPPSASQTHRLHQRARRRDLPADRDAVVLRRRTARRSIRRSRRWRSPAASSRSIRRRASQYEVGGKWDVLDGNLSLTAAHLPDREGQHALADLHRRLRADRQRPRARLPAERPPGRITQPCRSSAATPTSTPRSSRRRCSTTRKGKVPANTPKNSASLWTTYNFTREWQAGTGVAYMSDRFTSNTNAVKVDDYFRWDAMVAYQPAEVGRPAERAEPHQPPRTTTR